MTMRNDATRLQIATDDPRRLRSVVARQGLVLLDTDLNEQSRQQLDRIEVETVDTLGSPDRLVVPAGNTGFRCTSAGGIDPGHGYLRGWLLENAAGCTLSTQPHPRTGDSLAAPCIIVLKALIRYIDPVEQPVLADRALGDAQASGRSLIDWQVFPVAIAGGSPLTCASSISTPEWTALAQPSTGTLAFIRADAPPSTDPCSLLPRGGYTRLENLLYRVEVHSGIADVSLPNIDGPRFVLDGLRIKYSRRNASVMVAIEDIAGTELTVTPPALDPANWFAPGSWAEIVSLHDDVDPRAALANERLFKVAAATDTVVTLEGSAVDIAATGCVGTPGGGGEWFLRLWDGEATVKLNTTTNTSQNIDLGDGISLELGQGATSTIFRRGDFWACAMRADGSVDWPVIGAVAEKLPPQGPEIRYAPLAAVGATSAEDCRVPFATLTDRYLLYRGGDGQSIFAPAGATMVPLPGKLMVAVMRGQTAVPGASIRWTFAGPAGASCQIDGVACDAANPKDTTTDADGLAAVQWSIDAAHPLELHQIEASMLDASGTRMMPPITFTAQFDTAARTGYTHGQCALLNNVDNVQDALDTLCANIGQEKEPPTLLLRSILLKDRIAGHDIDLVREEFILNGEDVVQTAFTGGIFFGMEKTHLPLKIRPFDPVVEVELDLPYPTTDYDRRYWMMVSGLGGANNTLRTAFGFQRLRLDGTVELMEDGPNGLSGLVWQPSAEVVKFLAGAQYHRWGQMIFAHDPIGQELIQGKWQVVPPRELLCRIKLRSALIWAEGENGHERAYLNAEHLGVAGPVTGRELLVKERDPQVAADLDMFIYLVVKQ